MTREYFDVVVVIPLEEELLAFMEEFPSLVDRSTPTSFRHIVDAGRADLTILVVQQDSMGKGAAAKAAGSALEHFDAGLVVCLGIAGGLSDDLGLGDVCYSGSVIDVYDNAKVSDRAGGGVETQVSPEYFHTPSEMTAAFNFIRTQPDSKEKYALWQAERAKVANQIIQGTLPGRDGKPECPRAPKTLSGAIACGAVSKSETYNKLLRGLDRKLLAIETEAGGVFSVASHRNIPAMTIRGISDFADKTKSALEAESSGSVRKLAAANAASFFRLQLTNQRFLSVLNGRRRVRNGEQGSLALPSESSKSDLLTDSIRMLRTEIEDSLRKLSPEYRLQPTGYRLPLPRIRLAERDDGMTTGVTSPIDLVEGLEKHNTLLLKISRTYPDQCLSWVLAEELLSTEQAEKQILPIVIDGSSIRRKGISGESEIDIEKLHGSPAVQLVFVVEAPPLGSKSKQDTLLKELAKYPHAKTIYITRGDANIVAETEFEVKTGATRFDVCAISFFEITQFIRKNFSMSGSEADVVALRLRDTFEKFDLDAHPTYFAGISKETLTALLQANRRSELIQLAVDGFLTFLVAGDREDITLSRSTRARFLRQLVAQMKVERRSFNEEQLVGFTQEFAQAHDFDIKPIAFIQAFVDQGILHFEDDRVRVSLPFIESYLLASELATNVDNAERYFSLEDDAFDIATFDLYAEIGASTSIVKKIHNALTASLDALPLRAGEAPVLLTDQISPTNMKHLNRAEALQKRLQNAVEAVHAGTDQSSEKQKVIDAAERIRAKAGMQRELLKEALDKRSSDEEHSTISCATRAWAVATVLLGSGAEHLDAQTKRALSTALVRGAARIIDEWTRVQQMVDYEAVKRALTSEEVLLDLPGDESLDDKRRFAIGMAELLEHASVADPMRRVIGFLCEQARHRVLATSVEKVQVEGAVDKVIHGTWLTDIDSSKGRPFLKEAIRDLPASPFFRITLASHLVSRVYWNHWQKNDRLALLEAAESVIKVSKLTFGKPKLMRMIEKDSQKGQKKNTKRRKRKGAGRKH